MKNERTDQWGRWLQTTPMKQGEGALHKVDPETGDHLFCCLGLGLEKSQAFERKGDKDSDSEYTEDGDPIKVYTYDGAEGLPEGAFYLWLGFTEEQLIEEGWSKDDNNGLDCYLDAGEVPLLNQGTSRLGQHSLASLNDGWKLTFPQIGDLIRYFGVALRQVAR